MTPLNELRLIRSACAEKRLEEGGGYDYYAGRKREKELVKRDVKQKYSRVKNAEAPAVKYRNQSVH